MSNTLRNVVRKNLSSKFSVSESKKIESKLYAMCKTLHETQSHLSNLCEFDDFYKEIVYEKLAELLSYPERKDDILKDVINNNRKWNSCIYLNFRENERRDTTDQTESMKVSKGEFKCKVKTCRSDECYNFTMQTRSCDEGGTTYVVCSKCRGMYTIT
jgi:DNA-directed RNA polymerase subunit M/transcription elongation factor TFIIS